MIFTAEVPYTHKMIKNNENSILPLYQFWYSLVFSIHNYYFLFNLSHLSLSLSLSMSGYLSGCLCRNMKSLKLTHAFLYSFEIAKHLIYFLEKCNKYLFLFFVSTSHYLLKPLTYITLKPIILPTDVPS